MRGRQYPWGIVEGERPLVFGLLRKQLKGTTIRPFSLFFSCYFKISLSLLRSGSISYSLTGYYWVTLSLFLGNVFLFIFFTHFENFLSSAIAFISSFLSVSFLMFFFYFIFVFVSPCDWLLFFSSFKIYQYINIAYPYDDITTTRHNISHPNSANDEMKPSRECCLTRITCWADPLSLVNSLYVPGGGEGGVSLSGQQL